MAETSKGLSERDANQVLQSAYSQADASLTTSGFVTAKVGNKITFTTSTTSVANDTLNISFFDQQTILLYSLKLIFTDASQATILSVERTA